MAINVNTILQSVKTIVNKVQAGTFKPANFNIYATLSQQDVFNEAYELFQSTQKITDDLKPFITRSQLVVANGQVAYPNDYVHLISLRAKFIENPNDITCDELGNPIATKERNIQLIDNDKLGYRLDSNIAPPSYEYPIATLYATYIQIYPVEVGSCVFEYLRKPNNPIWGYTIVGNVPVYDAANSVDFEFNWQLTNKLIIKICGYYGITIRENELIEVAAAIDKKEP